MTASGGLIQKSIQISIAFALAAAVLFVSPIGAANASENVRVDMRALIIAVNSTEEDLAAWQAILDKAGMPYDVFLTTTQPPLTADMLSSGVDHARYQTVIVTTGDLLNCSGTCVPSFSTEEWAVLDTYQARFGIRRISGNTYPSVQHGLNPPTFSGDISDQRANLTTAGLATFPGLAGPVDIGVGVFGSYATPDPAANFTTLLEGPSASSLVGVHVRPDSIEELVITMAMGSFSLHTLVLGQGMLSWGTRGTYLGYERSYLTFDVDDIFLANDRWDTVNNVTWEDSCGTLPCIRMVPADVTRALDWSASTGLKITMAFNAFGATQGPDPLTDAMIANRYGFRWLNHTFTHTEFDSAAAPSLTQKQMIEEIQFNLNWAEQNAIPLNPKELVTGSHSGLRHPDTGGSLAATGIDWIAADNSRDPDPFAVGNATTLPRHPSNVYYNVGSFAEQLDEYNYVFYENCTNTPTTTCLTSPADWATYVDNEATIMLQQILGNDPRPHYYHQANLAEEGTFYPVVDEALNRYNLYMATPLVQPNYREAVDIISRTSDWAATRNQVETYLQLGKIYLTSPSDTAAPMTGLATGKLYGGERSQWINLKQNTTRIVDAGGLIWPAPQSSVNVAIRQNLDGMVNYGGFIWQLPGSTGSQ